jgi:hypothetical protein
MERPLFVPPLKPDIQETVLLDGETDIDPTALFEQAWVDRDVLRGHIRHALHRHSPASLSTVLQAHPLEQGLAELVTYLAIATEDPLAVIDETRSESVTWTDPDGRQRRARMPVILFTREGVQ